MPWFHFPLWLSFGCCEDSCSKHRYAVYLSYWLTCLQRCAQEWYGKIMK
jgi:hypothetical protein